MFETVNPPRKPRAKQAATLLLSMAAHTVAIALVVIVPLLYFTDQLPKPPKDVMEAFVVSAAPAPPPPPPPPAAPRPAQPTPATTAASPAAAPIEAPARIEPEPPTHFEAVREVGTSGIEGGVPGGIPGGVVGGMTDAPPPPPPPKPAGPVRVGGAIHEPALVHRVEPQYPQLAVQSKKEGLVVLEATVDTEGAVQAVKVLRSDPIFDRAATDAVKQWRYAPLLLNSQPQAFVVTVTINFNLR
jgi:periplasmic protein TonB